MDVQPTGHEIRMEAPSPHLMTRRAVLGSAALAVTAGVLVGAKGVMEPHWVEMVHVLVPIKDLPSEFVGYRIGQVSDIHYPKNMSAEFIQDAVTSLNTMEPDLLALTGDQVDRMVPKSPRSMAGMFDHCTAKDGMFAVMGNHDNWYDRKEVRRDLEENTSIQLIENTHVVIERGGAQLAIGGVGDLWSDHVDVRNAFLGVPEETPRVLLSHNPDVAESQQYLGVRVDLQLSGHTHGGEISLPFYGPLKVPSLFGRKYASGLVQGPAWPVYVNRGLCSPRLVRFGCRPEVTCIELVAA